MRRCRGSELPKPSENEAKPVIEWVCIISVQLSLLSSAYASFLLSSTCYRVGMHHFCSAQPVIECECVSVLSMYASFLFSSTCYSGMHHFCSAQPVIAGIHHFCYRVRMHHLCSAQPIIECVCRLLQQITSRDM